MSEVKDWAATVAGNAVAFDDIDNRDGSPRVQVKQNFKAIMASLKRFSLLFASTASPLSFGAKGDGVTDDTAALQAAVAAAAGGVLYVPPGNYKISDNIAVPARTRVQGAGKASRIFQSATGKSGLVIAGDDVTIDSLMIEGVNAAGVFAGVFADTLLSPTVSNCLISSWIYGVRFTGCKNITVARNKFVNGLADASSSSDILIYGGTGSTNDRVVITGNFCLSNSDSGISVDTNAGDRNVIISNNVIVPCDATGLSELPQSSIYRRYGIIVGYNGGSGTRASITGNLVRNIIQVGIYTQAAALPAGDTTITGNVVSQCGYGTRYPLDNSLRAGIMLASGGADVCSSNTISDCWIAGIKVAPNFNWTIANAPSSVIGNNSIARTGSVAGLGGDGIYLTNRPNSFLVTGNKIRASARYGINYETTDAQGGNCSMSGNQIDTTGGANGGIVLSNALGGWPCKVSGNIISGDDSTSNSVFNAGVYFNGKIDVSENTITKYYYGIYNADALARTVTLRADQNSIKGCNNGIQGALGAGPWLVSGNRFDTVTTPLVGSAVQGDAHQVGANTLIRASAAAAPTTGTYAVGDHVRNSTPASATPAGWYCTVAGTPGTWKPEANIP